MPIFARRAALLVIGLALAGCGARSLGGDGARADASVGLVAGSADAIDGAEASAFCASPAACNDDPNMSSLAGFCHELAGSWYCECNAGFSNNRATGRCRVGSICDNAGEDPWPTNVSFDTSDCAQRPDLGCASSLTLEQELTRLAQRDCHLPPLTFVRIVLVGGCATSLQTKQVSGQPTHADLDACLTKVLTGGRWTCGGDKDCALIEWDTVP